MELGQLKPIARTIELRHPVTDLPLGIRVSVISIEDDQLKALKRSMRDETLKLQQRNKYVKAEQEEKNNETLLFAASKGWEWYNPTGEEGDDGYDADAMPQLDGEVLEYNQKNFMRFIRELPWAIKQLTEEIDETKAFFDLSK